MAMLSPHVLLAQLSLSGKVTDHLTNEPLGGATITVNGRTTTTNPGGEFIIEGLPTGNYSLRAGFVGYRDYVKTIVVKANIRVNIRLQRGNIVTDEVIVRATRAGENTATTYKNVGRQELEKNNLGQDLPYLLNQTPSVVVSSDAGTGIGYTGIRIRGSDATRINVTLNGIPVNDAESQGTFFVDIPDIASSIDNIQIQRGVGTSTNGAGAFGGSLNIQTTTRRDSSYTEVNNSYGSFDTWKNSVNFGTGLINQRFTFEARLSRIKSDGYVDRGFSDLKSYFLTGAYYGKKDLIRANVFSGIEKTYQAWNGVPEDILPVNRRYNSFTYEDQTDNYQQDHYQLLYTHTFDDKLTANGALHYTYGRGYYEEYKDDDALSKYGIAPVIINDSVFESSDLVRRRWLDNNFYGLTYSLNYKPTGTFNLILGGAYNEYRGKHYGEVIWAELPYTEPSTNNGSIKKRYYDDKGVKTDFNVYLRGDYRLDKLVIFADLQYRKIGYSFLGYDRNLKNVQQKANLSFFNPKLGVTYLLNSQSNLYASFAVGNKEPNRDDYTESTPESRPKPERLNDLEAGYRLRGTNFQAGVNLFGMFYKDQLIVTGKINDVGAYTRQNVPHSYRTGVELDGSWKIIPVLSWAATASFSRNKIKHFTEYVSVVDENWDPIGEQSFDFKNSDIAFSPSFIGSSEITFNPNAHIEFALLSKYVSRQYLDNTSNGTTSIDEKVHNRQLNSFFVNDIRLRYHTPLGKIRDAGVTLLINNFFNELYESNGYTSRSISENVLYTSNYYFPQATRNFLLSLNLKF